MTETKKEIPTTDRPPHGVTVKRLVMYARGWKDIKSAPTKEGERFLAIDKDDFIFISAYNQIHVEGDGCYGPVDSCCGYYQDMEPVMWKKLC